MTATDIVRDLYSKYPNVDFLDERDIDDDKVALFFRFGGNVSGLEDLVKSYGVDYSIKNGKMRIIAQEDEDYIIDESVSKHDFIDAYQWAYGGSKKDAVQAYSQFDNESKQEIINMFKGNAKKSFLTDSLQESSNPSLAKKARKLADDIYDFQAEIGNVMDNPLAKENDLFNQDAIEALDYAEQVLREYSYRHGEWYGESLTEGNLSDGGWDEDQVEDFLKDYTKNFTEDGSIRTYYKSEKDYGQDILSKYYKVVEVSDGRTHKGDDMNWVISFCN